MIDKQRKKRYCILISLSAIIIFITSSLLSMNNHYINSNLKNIPYQQNNCNIQLYNPYSNNDYDNDHMNIIYKNNGIVAASNIYPQGTILKIINNNTHKYIYATVNDYNDNENVCLQVFPSIPWVLFNNNKLCNQSINNITIQSIPSAYNEKSTYKNNNKFFDSFNNSC